MKINGATANVTAAAPQNLKDGTSISKDASGNYTINLNDKSNKVDISQNPDKSWNVTIDGKQKLKLSDAEMKNLTINGNGGDDTFNVKNGDLKKLNINGGDGRDALKLGGDTQADKIVDRSKVNFDQGKRNQGDTVDYFERGPAKGSAGQNMVRSYRAVHEQYD